MPELSDRSDLEFEQRLADLERDLGPTLRTAYRGKSPMRPSFAAELRSTLSLREARRRPLLRLVGQRAWAALAAMVVGGLVVSTAVFAYRPQTVSASEVLDQLQNEAFGVSVVGPGPGCGPSPDVPHTSGGVIAMQSGPNGGSGSGPTTLANANELSDKLAAALGISGDQVRAAMVATIRADMPAPPPDAMASIAQQLGMSREQVCAAFFEGDGAITGFSVGSGKPGELGPVLDGPTGKSAVVVEANGKNPGTVDANGKSTFVTGPGKNVLNLNTATAEQLKVQADKLGVSTERLRAAVQAAVPATPPPPTLPGPDELIKRFAQNLGMPESKVRAAITQVEGNNGFYFAVPLPGLGR